jgi:hypothetical protein
MWGAILKDVPGFAPNADLGLAEPLLAVPNALRSEPSLEALPSLRARGLVRSSQSDFCVQIPRLWAVRPRSHVEDLSISYAWLGDSYPNGFG